ncbi:MAG: hypothetical protein N2255_03030 [Kiritimatiellae bacterium]|nr:hypothetical protein [Kiritimatiellia bacterium]
MKHPGKMLTSAFALVGTLLIAKGVFFGPLGDGPDIGGFFLWLGWIAVVLSLSIAICASLARHGLALFQSDVSFTLYTVLALPSAALAAFLGVMLVWEIVK